MKKVWYVSEDKLEIQSIKVEELTLFEGKFMPPQTCGSISDLYETREEAMKASAVAGIRELGMSPQIIVGGMELSFRASRADSRESPLPDEVLLHRVKFLQLQLSRITLNLTGLLLPEEVPESTLIEIYRHLEDCKLFQNSECGSFESFQENLVNLPLNVLIKIKSVLEDDGEDDLAQVIQDLPNFYQNKKSSKGEN